MHNVLVTGGAGFIGSNFVRFLLGTEPQVQIINLDVLNYAGSLENLKELPDPDRHTFIQGDICDRSLVDHLLREHHIQVRNCASFGLPGLIRVVARLPEENDQLVEAMRRLRHKRGHH